MLQTGIQVALEPQFGDLVKVVTVDMSIDSKQSLENGLDESLELQREWSPHLGREDVIVIKEILDPVH